MKVGVFSYYYLPVINGVVLTIADWKNWARRDGVGTVVCVPKLAVASHNDPDVFEYPSIPLWRRFGITVPIFPENAIEKTLGEKGVDIIHVHHPFYVGNLAIHARHALHIPLVFTYHTRYMDYAISYFPWVSKRLVQSLVHAIMAKFMNQCDAITVANDTLKHDLLKMHVQKPIFIVPPGIDTAKYGSGNRAATRKRLGLLPTDRVLLYVGRLAREKNIYFLMRSFVRIYAKDPNTKLVLAGNGLEESRLINFVRRKKLTKGVVFALHEDPDTIADIYACADVFLCASQTETFGRVIVEAMAAGLPVVALAGPSIVDILHDGINGRIVFKKTPIHFANTVLELLHHNTVSQAIGQMAKQIAMKEYDSAISWKKLRMVYESVLDKKQ